MRAADANKSHPFTKLYLQVNTVLLPFTSVLPVYKHKKSERKKHLVSWEKLPWLVLPFFPIIYSLASLAQNFFFEEE